MGIIHHNPNHNPQSLLTSNPKTQEKITNGLAIGVKFVNELYLENVQFLQ